MLAGIAYTLVFCYSYISRAWQLTYDLAISDDDSEIFMLQAIVTIILSIVCLKTPKPMLSLAYFGFYVYHFYTAYDLIGE